jgi:hypothetical protein
MIAARGDLDRMVAGFAQVLVFVLAAPVFTGAAGSGLAHFRLAYRGNLTGLYGTVKAPTTNQLFDDSPHVAMCMLMHLMHYRTVALYLVAPAIALVGILRDIHYVDAWRVVFQVIDRAPYIRQ